ncbi:WD40-repeat-containing domain protein [Phellopilus nigrolimitatus]|nr:WD40-repeat-containing domain protein [Phellopilus nigrolimitatus]
MSTAPQRLKNQRAKASKSRPPATSTISQPVVEDAWSSTVLSAFSPDAQLFAFLSLAIDKHRLRIYDVNANRAIAELVVDRARVTSLAWIPFDSKDKRALKEKESSPTKKRKKLDLASGNSEAAESSPAEVQAVALGLSDGSVQLFSAVHGSIIRTLSHPASKSPVLAMSKGSQDGKLQSLWTSYADGVLLLWDVRKGEVLISTQSEERAPYSALAVCPGADDEQTLILTANNSIHLLSSSSDPSASDLSDADTIKMVCSFSGHASTVKSLHWDSSTSPVNRFYSSAEDDRFVYIWETSDLASSKGRMVASCPTDTDVRQIDVSGSLGKRNLLSLSSSGKITLSPVPAELSTSSGTKTASKQQVPTLLPRTTIALSSKKSASDVCILAAVFLSTEEGRIRIAFLSGGAKVAFETVEYLDATGEYITELSLQPNASAFGLVKEANAVGIVSHRYNESASVNIATGTQIPNDPSLDPLVDREVEGALDADLAELSLGQRLAARTDATGTNGIIPGQRSSGSDAEDDQGLAKPEKKRKTRIAATTVPAHSLTRTLIQALHAGDTSLLEACLAHSDEALVRNTVARLPPQLAVPLLTACVERLGRGGRGNGVKGRGGGASAQRGMALVKWVRAVLTIHSGHLMTMPDLVARLSHLHSTLTTRLTLQERLLTLSGRLDLVLAQVELRSSNAPAPLPARKKKNRKRGKAKKEPLKYVEGESSDDEEQMQVEVEGGKDDGSEDDGGSVEDVELGGDSDEESDDDEEEEESDEEEEEEDDDEDDADTNLMNGFIDNEAEDYDEDESEEDSD